MNKENIQASLEEEAEVLVSVFLPSARSYLATTPQLTPEVVQELLAHFLDPVNGSNAKGRKPIGMCCLHVDDLFITGTPDFLEKFKRVVKSQFKIGHEDINDLMFTGQRVKWVIDEKTKRKSHIVVEQSLCVGELTEVVLPKGLKDEDKCDKDLHTAYRSLLGTAPQEHASTFRQFQAVPNNRNPGSMVEENHYNFSYRHRFNMDWHQAQQNLRKLRDRKPFVTVYKPTDVSSAEAEETFQDVIGWCMHWAAPRREFNEYVHWQADFIRYLLGYVTQEEERWLNQRAHHITGQQDWRDKFFTPVSKTMIGVLRHGKGPAFDSHGAMNIVELFQKLGVLSPRHQLPSSVTGGTWTTSTTWEQVAREKGAGFIPGGNIPTSVRTTAWEFMGEPVPRPYGTLVFGMELPARENFDPMSQSVYGLQAEEGGSAEAEEPSASAAPAEEPPAHADEPAQAAEEAGPAEAGVASIWVDYDEDQEMVEAAQNWSNEPPELYQGDDPILYAATTSFSQCNPWVLYDSNIFCVKSFVSRTKMELQRDPK
eukprot:s800_g4.t1